MKIKIIILCITTTISLVMVSLVPSVESLTTHTLNKKYIILQIKTINHNILNEKLHNYDLNNHYLQMFNKLIETIKTNFHIVIPGILLWFLYYLAFIMQIVSIGPFLYFLGLYLDFFVMMTIEILRNLGIEVYYPYYPISCLNANC